MNDDQWLERVAAYMDQHYSQPAIFPVADRCDFCGRPLPHWTDKYRHKACDRVKRLGWEMSL